MAVQRGTARSTRPMLDELIEDLKFEEGWVDHPYRDSLGLLTIGYGFLIDERRNIQMPKAVGELWLKIVAQEKFNDLANRSPWILDLPEDVQRALGNMCYQMGVDGVLRFRRMMNALGQGDRNLAAQEALNSKWAKQTPERAKRVTDLMRGSND